MPEAAQIELRDDSIVAVTPRQIPSDLGAEAAILRMESGNYHSLNPVGERVWQLFQPVAQMCRTASSFTSQDRSRQFVGPDDLAC